MKWFVLVGALVIAACANQDICPNVDTACTDGRTLIVLNPEFVKMATHEEVAFAALHETAHIVLLHRNVRGLAARETAADLWALSMIKPGFDFCRLAHILKTRDRLERATMLCPPDQPPGIK